MRKARSGCQCRITASLAVYREELENSSSSLSMVALKEARTMTVHNCPTLQLVKDHSGACLEASTSVVLIKIPDIPAPSSPVALGLNHPEPG